MSFIPLLKPEDASSEVRAVYEEFYRRMSFPSPPNFIMTQGHSPTVARGTWGVVEHVLVMGEIPRWIKEMMFVAISKDRNCRYCTAAHIACCRMLGVAPGLLEELVSDISRVSDLRVRDILLFGLKCSRNPQSLAESDFDSLRQHGFKESEIMEVIAMSAFAVYANIVADATAMSPDEMFGTIGANPRTRNVHVAMAAGGWSIFRDDDQQPVSTHRTREDAMEAGRDLAKRNAAMLVVHNTDSTIHYSESYHATPSTQENGAPSEAPSS